MFERNADVGGTWLLNDHPGCRVDVASHNYTYSFAPRLDWPEHFSRRDLIFDYFRDFAESSGVRTAITFGAEVVRATFREDLGRWEILVRTTDGERTATADIFVCATGQLNQPNLPDVPGRDSFARPSFHSARWNHDVELTGRRVAVIGTGASAFQFIPVVAGQAERLLVLQRNPGWLIPTPNVHDSIPGSLRWLRDNGVYAAALQRDNVELVTERIARITPRGIVMADGTEHEVDVIIYGTGFRASEFLTPMQVVGRGGIDLHTRWKGDSRAYLGVTVPDFPNMFLLYGPNTNLVIHGSIVMFTECEVVHMMECLRHLLTSGRRAMDCRPEAHDRYNAWIDEGNALRAWGYSTVSSWYKNATGRSSQNWPYSILDFWERTRRLDPADYELL